MIGHEVLHLNENNLNIENDFNRLIKHIKAIFENLYDGLVDFEGANLAAIKSLKAKDSVAISLNHPEIISQVAEIPEEGEKDKKQIFELDSW